MNASFDSFEASSISVHPLVPERLQDWLRFFDHDAFADHREWSFCYCYCLHADESVMKWADRSAQDNRQAVIPLIQQRQLKGLLAYAVKRVVGWCHAAPGADIPALHDEPGAMEDGVGNIVCFVIAAPWRRKGVARRLLEGACNLLRSQGMSIAQAYPAKNAPDSAAMHFGPLTLYLDAGFQVWRDSPEDPSFTVRRKL
jgi:GNAT superfamily N-acetyltransferase